MQVTTFYSDLQAFKAGEAPDMGVEVHIEKDVAKYYWFYINPYFAAPLQKHHALMMHGPYDTTQEAIDAGRQHIYDTFWIIQTSVNKANQFGPFENEEAQIQAAMALRKDKLPLVLTSVDFAGRIKTELWTKEI